MRLPQGNSGSISIVATLWLLEHVQSKRCAQTLNNKMFFVDDRLHHRHHHHHQEIILRCFPFEIATVAPAMVASFPRGYSFVSIMIAITWDSCRARHERCMLTIAVIGLPGR